MQGLSQLLALSLVLTLPAVPFQTTRRGRGSRNRAPRIVSFTSTQGVFSFCPFSMTGSCGPSKTVGLKVEASDPENDTISFKYSVSAGIVSGSGSEVSWDLTRSPQGIQTAMVEVADSRGSKTSSTITVEVILCGACDPPCPTISVSCPSQVVQGDIVEFVAYVGDPSPELKYMWRHSHGKRMDGPDGPNLKIQAIGSPGQVITATLEMVGFDPACNRAASCQSTITKK
jgi:hypothetical protein